MHLTQVHVDGPLGAPDVHGDGVLAGDKAAATELCLLESPRLPGPI